MTTQAQDQVAASAGIIFKVKDDMIVWGNKVTYGYRNISTLDTFNTETIIRIASISKMITTIAFMKLVEQGKINLDEDISNIMGFSFAHRITPRMLLSHTSGLSDGKYYGDFLNATYNETIPQLAELFVTTGKYFDSSMYQSKGFEYANINFGIIGTLIEKITSQRFDLYMQKEIFLPLKIKASYNFADIYNEPNRAMPYRYENGWQAQTDINTPTSTNLNSYVIGSNAVRLGPHGGLRISVGDLAILTALLMNDGKIQGVRLLNPASVQLMKKMQWNEEMPGDTYNGFFKSYGLGTQSYKIGKRKYFGHSGEAYGLVSGAYFSKDKGFVYIISGARDGYLTQHTFSIIEEEILHRLGILKPKPVALRYENQNFIAKEEGTIIIFNSGKEIIQSRISPNTPLKVPLAIDDHYSIDFITKRKKYRLELQK